MYSCEIYNGQGMILDKQRKYREKNKMIAAQFNSQRAMRESDIVVEEDDRGLQVYTCEIYSKILHSCI